MKQKREKSKCPDIVAKIFLWEGVALYIGKLCDTTPHKHHAAQVCYGLDGDFDVIFEDETLTVRFIAIPANCSHQLVGGKTRLAFALLDDASDLEGHIPAARKLSDIESDISNMPYPKDIPEAHAYLERLLAPLSLSLDIPSDMDSRIERALERIANPAEEQIVAKDLADMVNLSESRFLHLFSQHTGLPLRRYVLWRRIIKSIEAITGGTDLTAAAHIGGFSDSAHFSRTFRETFGLSPSQLFNSSRNIQVFT